MPHHGSSSQVMRPDAKKKKTDEYEGIEKYAGGQEKLEKWDNEIIQNLKDTGGAPWVAIWNNKHEEITPTNVRIIADELRLATIDPTDATKAFGVIPAAYYREDNQKTIRSSIFKKIYHVAFQSTKEKARSAIDVMKDENANLIRDKMYSLWGKKQTSDKQELQTRFQAGISNVDNMTKFKQKDDVKAHIEKLDQMQQKLRDMTPKDDRAADSTLTKNTLMTIIKASLPPIYGPTMAAFDDAIDSRRDISLAMVAAGGNPLAIEQPEQLFIKIKNKIYNFYEAKSREWKQIEKEEGQREIGEAKMQTNGTPTMMTGNNALKNKRYSTGGYQQKACNNFQAGHCKYGDRCRFSHNATDKCQPEDKINRAGEEFSKIRCWDCGEYGHMRGYYTCKMKSNRSSKKTRHEDADDNESNDKTKVNEVVKSTITAMLKMAKNKKKAEEAKSDGDSDLYSVLATSLGLK